MCRGITTCLVSVAPVRERGLKSNDVRKISSLTAGRSRKGAWIEIACIYYTKRGCCVAPVRERGLKCLMDATDRPVIGVAPVRERGLKCLSYN